MTAIFGKGAQVPLPCGCVLGGNRMCAVARFLWDVATQARYDARGAETWAKWRVYEIAERAYRNHFVGGPGRETLA